MFFQKKIKFPKRTLVHLISSMYIPFGKLSKDAVDSASAAEELFLFL
jgi:hypothetical protein